MPDETVPGESVAVILARLEIKLDTGLTHLADHETRIRLLERKIWTATGVASLLSAALSSAIAAFAFRALG